MSSLEGYISKIGMMGFGAKLNNEAKISHCFSLTGKPDDCTVEMKNL